MFMPFTPESNPPHHPHEPRPTNAREALTRALSEELGRDVCDDLYLATDRLLSRLWIYGFIVVPNEADEEA